MTSIDGNEFEKLSKQITELSPALKVLTQDPLCLETRKAQNFCILYSSVAIALYFGIFELKTVTAAGITLAASASATVVLLALVSLFFLVRFFLFAYRDTFLMALEGMPAAVTISGLVGPQTENLKDYEKQCEALIKGAISAKKPLGDVADQFELLELSFVGRSQEHHAIGAIIDNSIDRVKRLNLVRRYLDFWLPGLLTFASIVVSALVILQSLRTALPIME